MVKADLYQKLTRALDAAFHQLGLEVSQPSIESLANLVFSAMTAEGRYYHTPGHALSLTDVNDPVQTLAALFHDIVYVQIDHGFAPEISKILTPYLQGCGDEGETWCLVEGVPANQLSFHLVKDLFGIQDGQRLFINEGSNEFISSLVMAKSLEAIVPRQVLLKIACDIEATIPFRKNGNNGSGPFAVLAERLRKVSHTYNIPMDEAEIDQTIQGAVRFANLDVKNFYDPNPANFLENTWRLLPEINPALRRGLAHSIADYRQALQAMIAFLSSVRPEDVLHEYKGMPPAAELQAKLAYIRQNLQLGSAYLEIHLLACAILEALDEVSAGLPPRQALTGEITRDRIDHELDQLIPFPPSSLGATGEARPQDSLSALLQSGSIGGVDFSGVHISTLAAMIYQGAMPGKLREYLKAASQVFEGKMNAQDFLHFLDADLLRRIIEALITLSPERRDRLTKRIAQETN